MAEAMQAAPLSIALELDGYRPSIAVSGQADQTNISPVVAVLDRLADEHERCVSLDLGGLESLDAAAAESFVGSLGIFRSRQKRLHLKCASEPVQCMLDRLLISDAFCVEEECCRKRGSGPCRIAAAAWEMDVFTLPASLAHCHEARARVDCVAQTVGFAKRVRDDISLAVGEAVTNAIEHGGHKDPNNCFTVSCLGTPERMCVSVSDGGGGFCLDDLPSLEEAFLLEHGRGVHCINAMMDEVSFDFNGGTTVRMVKLGA